MPTFLFLTSVALGALAAALAFSSGGIVLLAFGLALTGLAPVALVSSVHVRTAPGHRR